MAITNLEKIRSLRWQYAGNALNVIFWFTAAYGTIFTLFLDELGFDKARIGFLISLVPFCGPIALIVAPFAQRFGFKRTFLIFYTIRKFCSASLLLTPLILGYYGHSAAFLWVAGAVLAFSICRATAETAIWPWSQEIIPDSIRGKFSAINTSISIVISIATFAICGYVLGRFEGLNTFMLLMVCGIVAGLASAWCFSFSPGGAPVPPTRNNGAHFNDLLAVFKDKNYCRFIYGLSLVSLIITAVVAFAPLYLKEQIGLSSGMVIWIDIGGLVGGLLSCYLWGWASDRYGSKPIMLTGVLGWIIYPIIFFMMPRNSSLSVPMALTATFIMGIANNAWAIGFTRYLLVSAVPPEKKTPYLAVFYAGVGLAGGVGPLLAGALLKACKAIDIRFFIFHIDAYTPLFAITVVIFFVGAITLAKVRSDGAMAMRKFIGMFLQGNALLAAGSLVRYHRATDEAARVLVTERLGYANNPLSNNELIEALNDPSFNVRYEAIIAIAHMTPNAQLIDALLLILGGNEPDLSIHAAWALGKIGDKSAIISLRETLYSQHDLLGARSARALATLGDADSIPTILDHFRKEENPGLRIAYAQALGKLRSTTAISEMLAFFWSLNDETLRSEMALAIGRIIGDESRYISLWRQMRTDPDTVYAQQLMMIAGELVTSRKPFGGELAALAERASAGFARGDIDHSISMVITMLKSFGPGSLPEPLAEIFADCAGRLGEFGARRPEYILIAIHALETVARSMYADRIQMFADKTPEANGLAAGAQR